MQSLAIDDKNNIIIDNNRNIKLVSNKEALRQDIYTKLSITKGEHPYNLSYGIDYLKYINDNNIKDLLAEIQKKITEDKRVSSCSLEHKKEGDRLSIKASTIYGSIEI